ncbi:MAG: hypothetical protein ACRCYP_03735 [Alphaproteobacteria bacterium]
MAGLLLVGAGGFILKDSMEWFAYTGVPLMHGESQPKVKAFNPVHFAIGVGVFVAGEVFVLSTFNQKEEDKR